MAKNITQPIRMCVVCRGRFAQSSLIRLQCKDANLYSFSGSGRSFYICSECVDDKKTPYKLAHSCRTKAVDTLMNQLKEIVVDDR